MSIIKQNTTPQNDVKNPISVESLGVSINFTVYKNWTKGVRIDKYTNFFHNDKECGKTYYYLVSKMIPFLQEKHKEIVSGKQKHCHIIEGKKRDLAIKIAREIHGKKVIDDETEIWQFGYGQGLRLIGVIYNDLGKINIIPLFVDPHHLLFPSENHNVKDYGKKSCNFCPKKRYD